MLDYIRSVVWPPSGAEIQPRRPERPCGSATYVLVVSRLHQDEVARDGKSKRIGECKDYRIEDSRNGIVFETFQCPDSEVREGFSSEERHNLAHGAME